MRGSGQYTVSEIKHALAVAALGGQSPDNGNNPFADRTFRRDKQQQQPDGAFLPQAIRAGVQIGLLQRQRRPLKLSVFGDVIFQQMGDSALGQAADELAVGDHRHHVRAAMSQLAGNIGTFILRFDLQKLRNHQRFHRLYRIGGLQQFTHGNHARQAAIVFNKNMRRNIVVF
mgnify:CR=1 FL=1